MNWFPLFVVLALWFMSNTRVSQSLHIHHIASMNTLTDSALLVKQSASAGFMTSMLNNFPNLTYNVSKTNNENFLVIQKTLEAIQHVQNINDTSIILGPSFTEPATITIDTLRANKYNDTSAFLLMTGDAIRTLKKTFSALSTVDLRTEIMVQMLQAFQWRHIDVLHINNQFGLDFYNSLLRAVNNKNITLLSFTFQNEKDLEVSLRSIELSKRRVVILVTGIQFAAQSLKLINSLDAFNDEYVWLVDGVFNYNQSQLPNNWFQFAPTGYTNQTKYDEISNLYTSLYSQTSAWFPSASSGLISQTLWGYTLGEYLTMVLNSGPLKSFSSVFGEVEQLNGFLNTGHTITQPKLGSFVLYPPDSIQNGNLTLPILQNFYVNNNDSFSFVLDSCGTTLQYRTQDGVCLHCPDNTFNFFGDGLETCFPCSSGDTISADGAKCVNLEDGEGLTSTEITVILLSVLIPTALMVIGYLIYKRYKFLQVENEIIKTNYENQSRFVDFLCHEIRNPLNIVFSYLQFSIDSLKDPEKDEFDPHQLLSELEKCIFSCEHAIDILNNVLSVSKIQNNDVITKLETFDVLDTINHVLKMLDHTKNENVVVKTIVDGIHVRLDDTKAIKNVMADRRMIKQIMLNLIINAFKFTHDGFVEVSVIENSTMGTVISVLDTGIGLNKHAFNYVMNPGVTTYNGKGNGIGIYVVHEYLKCMNSKLMVQSPLPNGLQGSMFQFALKLSDSQQKYQNQPQLNIDEIQSSRSNSSFSNNDSPKEVVLEMKKINQFVSLSDMTLTSESPTVKIIQQVSSHNNDEKNVNDNIHTLLFEKKSKPLRKLSILVVDDSSLNVNIIIRTLKKFIKKEGGYDCTFVTGYSLKDIQTRLLALETYDMVIFDQNLQSNQTVTMKTVNDEDRVIHVGSEMLQYMKELPKYKSVAGVIYSGSVQQQDLELYRSHGADFVLKKPLQLTNRFKEFFRKNL